MRLYYFASPRGNFGDDLNLWLWPRLLPDFFEHPPLAVAETTGPLDQAESLFIGIGTLLNDLVPSGGRKVIFGSGIGYGRGLPNIGPEWDIQAVRGPLSAQALGLPADAAVTDSAVLLRDIVPPAAGGRDVIFMPHWETDAEPWREICNHVGIRYMTADHSVDEVLSAFSKARLVITEAMHGAIVADALRVPWVPVLLSDHVLDFKWQDWTQSLGLRHRFARLPRLWNVDPAPGTASRVRRWIKHRAAEKMLARLAQGDMGRLSDDARFDNALAELRCRLDVVRHRYRITATASAR